MEDRQITAFVIFFRFGKFLGITDRLLEISEESVTLRFEFLQANRCNEVEHLVARQVIFRPGERDFLAVAFLGDHLDVIHRKFGIIRIIGKEIEATLIRFGFTDFLP